MMLAVFALIALPNVAAMDNGVGRTPPLGWNTWKTCGEETCGHDICNEAEVKSVASAMLNNGMASLGYEYINLDDCWASPNRDPQTHALTWDVERFPSGLPSLINWLHEKGLKFGLYTSAGNQTCSSGGRAHPIPGSRDHYDIDAKAFASWGVDYVKLDWCGDIKKDIIAGRDAHLNFSRAMNSSGRAMFLEVVAGYFFMWSDISKVSNSWRFCTDHHDDWKSTNVEITCRLDQTQKTVGTPGGWPFMDMLITGGQGCSPFSKGAHCPGQTEDEYRTAFAVWSLSQSPLIVSSDIRVMTQVMNQTLLNKDLVDLHQSTETAPGKHLSYWHCSEPLMCEVWGRKISADGSSWMVALVNHGKKSHNITVDWKLLGFQDREAASVVDVWDVDRRLVRAKNATVSYTARVPSHGTAMVKIAKLHVV